DIDPSLPKPVDDIIVRCLQPDPAARFQTTGELAAALDRLDANGKPLPALRRLTRRMIAAALTVVALLVGATFWIGRVSGATRPRASGYEISVRALEPADARPVAEASARASNKGEVLRAVGTLASQMRAAFGDTASRSQRLAAGETLTASSLEAVQSYSMAQDLATAGRYAESIPHYKRAVEADPNFGRAYPGWATSEYRIGHEEQAADP